MKKRKSIKSLSKLFGEELQSLETKHQRLQTEHLDTQKLTLCKKHELEISLAKISAFKKALNLIDEPLI